MGKASALAVGTLAAVWATLAIYYSNLPRTWMRVAAAALFAGFGVYALWIGRSRRTVAAFAALFAGVVVWETLIPPSHDRNWRPEVAVLPRAEIDGDRVRLTGVRDFDYRSANEFTVRYLEREIELSHVTGMDFFLSYWMAGPVGHTFVSFRFDNAPPLCISIETRPEAGEEYSPIASLFRQYELVYVVGEERDIVGVRTNHRNEEVYLYPLQVSAAAARRMLEVYLQRINEIADRPEWYHLLRSNCTLNIVRYANAAGRHGAWDIRHYLNGWSDRYLYRTELVDTSLPFADLRSRSRIDEVAREAEDAPGFPERIRASLPGVSIP